MQKIKSNQHKNSGVALLIVLFSLLFMSIIAYELIYASRVDLRITANARNRLQAWYLAQSSARLSLIRLHLYRIGSNMVIKNKNVDIPTHILNQVWSFPLPSFPLASQVYGEDHRLPGEMNAVIRSEGSRIPINLLDANTSRNSSEDIAKDVAEEILQLINNSIENDDEFNNNYSGLRAEELVNPIIDWIDLDLDKKEGGDEIGDYEDFNPPYEPRNDRISKLSELRLIKGWTDDLYNRFASEFSVFKTSHTLNPNIVSLKRIKSFHPAFETEDLRRLDEKRREQPFANLKEMREWINLELPSGRGFDYPLNYISSTSESLFTIESTGIVGLSRRTIKLTVRLEDKQSKKKATTKAKDPTSTSDDENPEKKDRIKKPVELDEPTVVGFEVIV